MGDVQFQKKCLARMEQNQNSGQTIIFVSHNMSTIRELCSRVIVLKSGVEGTEALKVEIQQMVRQRLSTHSYPREIDFVASLPKTPSGKIQRFILRGNS